MNLIGVYISIWVFSILLEYRPFNIGESLLVSAVVAVFYFFSVRNSPMEEYLGSFVIITLTILFFSTLNFAFVYGMRKTFSILLAFFIFVSGFTINPLARGTDPIYEKVISKKILEIEKRFPGAKWAGVNNLIIGNLFIALGVKSFNSVHVYPDLSMWKKLDLEGKYMEVYNRYANIDVELTTEPTRFELIYPDHFRVNININDLDKTDIKFIVSYGLLLNYGRKLRLIDEVKDDNLYIYEVEN
jgi:hypothetical protein